MGGDLLSLRVLVVSDNETDRNTLRVALSQAPVPVDLEEIADCGTATAACESLRRNGADIIFVDGAMSPDDRRSVRDAAARNPARTFDVQPWFITLGMNAAQRVLVAGEEAVGEATLAKPFDRQLLQQMIERCVSARVPKRVLIVDDSSTVRAVIRKVLHASRYRIEADEAEEGHSAIARVAQQPYDLVFLDCNMPELDGFATLAVLLRNHPELKVVMVSGTSTEALAAKVRGAGAKGLLLKPFYAKDIDGILNRIYSPEQAKA